MDSKLSRSASRWASDRSRSSRRVVHSSRSRPRFSSRSAWEIVACSRFSSASRAASSFSRRSSSSALARVSSAKRPLSLSSRSTRSASVRSALLPEEQVCLALADRLVLGGDAHGLLFQVVLARDQPPLALRDLLVAAAELSLALVERPLAAVEPHIRGALARLELLLAALGLLLTVGQGGELLGELGLCLLAVAVGALQLAQPRLCLLLPLERELLLCGGLGLELGDSRVLELDRLALAEHLPLALFEGRLELGQLCLTLVERGRAAGELLVGAATVVESLGLLLQPEPERLLAPLRRLELQLERAQIGIHSDRLGVGRRPGRQLEAQLDVRRPLRVAALALLLPPLELRAQPRSEALFGLSSTCVRGLGHGRRLR